MEREKEVGTGTGAGTEMKTGIGMKGEIDVVRRI